MLILTGANIVAELLGKQEKQIKKQTESWWKNRFYQRWGILGKISVNWNNGKVIKNADLKRGLEQKYYVRRKGIKSVIKELKQRVKSKAAKIRSYEERNNQYIQNYLFNTNQKCLFEILEGNEQQNK